MSHVNLCDLNEQVKNKRTQLGVRKLEDKKNGKSEERRESPRQNE
jgi:hypothetical protein